MYIFIGIQTGSLTSRLSDHPQKVNGLAGITMGTIIQSIACLIAGAALGLAFLWKLALVGIGASIIAFKIRILHQLKIVLACVPLLVSTGYIRLVSCGVDHWLSCTNRTLN